MSMNTIDADLGDYKPAKCALWVTIGRATAGLKPWMLLIDAPTYTEKLMIHLVGSPTAYRVEKRFWTDYDENRVEYWAYLGDIPNSDTVYDKIIQAGEGAEIDNDDPSYNCQDYILDVLEELERLKIVSKRNSVYRENKWNLESKKE
ncbi:hypothetical protein AbraIFM66951_007861 [Aspergillus brasiliensis]|uniref:Uncharacterized protein n=1 Tax=Aspergillus brasiliensis TaxID=319629 RepID=A0A9W6DTF8_9EURO|nr:hypothetical protein AbraCBS73388_002522 [Aspergillus brasiliensis]GKZ45259.1 hypothetical protein AbraIFM66951_007861 [Aspergillus brasiliensis]